ncbi:hypothetical protein CLOM_g14725 [Closterium sp. NIES-68]|nr:hypothetical protein CLOM_g14725 [Closterium sp. NIES-68]
MTGPLPSPANRTRFKTPEGRYLLSHEKLHPAGLIQYAHQRSPTKSHSHHISASRGSASACSPSFTVASCHVSRLQIRQELSRSGKRHSRAALWRWKWPAVSNGTSSQWRICRHGGCRQQQRARGENRGRWRGGEKEKAGGEGEGSYVIFNVGESLFVADANSTDKDPLKAIQFNATSGLCHAFDAAAASRDAQGTAPRDAHDLLIGTNSGDIYTASLRAQLADGTKKLVGAAHYSNRDSAASSGSGIGSSSSSSSGKDSSGGSGSRCTAVAWVPGSDGVFVTAHADGNLYVFDKHRDGTTEPAFPPIKDLHAFSTAHARSNKSNPTARWHISPSAITAIAFSPSGSHMATVSRDGYLRVFEWEREALEGGCKSYYGAFLCCAFSGDGRLVAAGGEDDLVAVWDRHSHSVLAWCEGHCSWVTAVAFDPFLAATPPSSTTAPPATTTTAAATTLPSSTAILPTSTSSSTALASPAGAVGSYRLGSVGQDTQLLLWDVTLDDVVLPLRHHAPHPHHQSPAATSASHPHDVASTSTPPVPHSHSRSHFSHFHSHSPGHASPSRTHGATSAPGTASSASSLGPGRTSGGSSGALRDAAASNAAAAGVLVPPPSRKDVPRISPVMAHKVHVEPLSSLAFAREGVLTACHEGCVKLWIRPGVTPLPGSIAASSAAAATAATTAPALAAASGPAAAAGATTAAAALPAASPSPLPANPQFDSASLGDPLSASDVGSAVHRMTAVDPPGSLGAAAASARDVRMGVSGQRGAR